MKSHPSYELISSVGRGRLATVYRARDLALKREVAVKELNDRARRDESLLQRFWEEARFLAGVEHDCVVQIYGLDQERGWIIMELAAGGLNTAVAERPLSPEVVRGVLHQVLDGLDCLHHQGRVHGAIKPSNLLVTSPGLVKISDTTGAAGGPVSEAPAKYLAPEQLDQTFGPVGPGMDLYCLGFTALELLTGPSFDDQFGSDEGENSDQRWRRVHGNRMPLPAAATVVPDLPADLARVIDRLLQKNVAARYASAGEAIKDLEDIPAPPVPAPPAPVTLPPVQSTPAPLLNQPTVHVPPAIVTSRMDNSARETLQPTMFPVLQSSPARAAPFTTVAPSPAPPPGVPAMETIRDTPQYPRWSRRWVNQKLENPRVLYPVIGTIAFVTVLLLADLLTKRPTPPHPVATPPAVTTRNVKVTSSPTGATVLIDGKRQNEKTDATFALRPGKYDIAVELKGVGASKSVEVAAEGPEPEPVDFQLVTVAPPPPPTTAPAKLPPVKPTEPLPGKLLVRSNPGKASIFVDGKSRGETPADFDLPPGRYTVRLEHVRHKPVEQTVEVEAGKSLSIRPTLPWFRDGASFALLVGVRSAGDGLPLIRYAPAEMAELGRTLLAAGYGAGNVTVLSQSTDQAADKVPTAERIRQAVKDLVHNRIPDDTLLLALDGPAVLIPDASGGFFCPADADLAKADTLVSLDWIFRLLVDCPAETKVVLIDGNRVGLSVPARAEPARPETVAPSGVVVLTATSSGKPGYVRADDRNGVFWYFVLRGLRGAAQADGGKVTVGSLARYVIDETKKYVAETYKADQAPYLVASDPKTLSRALAAPDEALRLVNEGDALEAGGQAARAIEKYSKAIQLREDLLDAYLHRAVADYGTGDYDKMIADGEAVLRRDPGNAAALDFLGDANRKKAGKPADMNVKVMRQAIQNYEAALKSDPDFAPTYYSLGVARAALALALADKKEPVRARTENEAAVRDLSRAIDLAPKPRWPYFDLRGTVYKRLDNPDRAADDRTAALQTGEQLDPKELSVLYYKRGVIQLVDLKDFDRAEADFAKAASLNPDDPDPLVMRARALDRLNRKEEARKDREKAEELKRRAPAGSK
jgi:serine/threonine-protein kinase